MKEKTLILDFGIYKGKSLDNPAIPDNYILWLAKPKYSAKFYKSLHVTDLKWKIPFTVTIEARKEAERRGYVLKGEMWEKA